ncbi:MAG: hypothetical protein A3I63_08480 [Betaproteobacteria bacterium RIFCSPLOWO2_02_FULL_66_14]|nr:MAG: hypothetical protein A3I63_08480 [Betaproteobacteria bacterium RIFCSPLOWO2_02_FULL_66_14]
MVAGILEHLVADNPSITRLSREPVLLDALATCADGSWNGANASKDAVAAWHAKWPGNGKSAIKIIDLGCGEGYRGRWLARKAFQYRGVDYSKTLIESALKRARKVKCPVSPMFEVLDLSLDGVADLLRPLAQAPVQLFIAVTLLDHLDDEAVKRLLSSLSQLGGEAERSYLFVATCNPHYYCALANLDDGQLAHAPIESLCERGRKKVEVTIYKRSRSYYRDLFHRVRLLVLEQATPVPRESPTKGMPDFDHGTGPFHCWLIQLHGRQWRDIDLDKAINSLPDGKVGKRILSELGNCNVKHLRVVDTTKDEPIVAAGNLGGDLLVLINGHCHLATGDQGLPRLPFLAGDLFGDLELNAGSHRAEPIRYRRSIIAGESCVVAVIPQELTKKVLLGTSLESELLSMLRSRLQSQVWLMDAKSGEFGLHGKLRKSRKFLMLDRLTQVSDSVAQTTHYLAACLMGALERQRNDAPKFGATLLLQDVSKNVMSIGHVDSNTIPTAIELLVCSGVIYAANLTYAFSPYPVISALHEESSGRDGQADLWRLYWDHLEDGRESPFLPSFFFIEDEWVLRYLGSRPDFSSTKLLDRLLFLNGHRLTSLIGWKQFARRNVVLSEAGSTFAHRLDRFLREVQRYVNIAIRDNHRWDSLGFLLARPSMRRTPKPGH